MPYARDRTFVLPHTLQSKNITHRFIFIVDKNEPPEHLHLLSSFELGWQSLNLIYEIEPADEMAEMHLHKHFILIPDNNFTASFMIDGRWKHIQYTKGDIAIIPATQAIPHILHLYV